MCSIVFRLLLVDSPYVGPAAGNVRIEVDGLRTGLMVKDRCRGFMDVRELWSLALVYAKPQPNSFCHDFA